MRLEAPAPSARPVRAGQEGDRIARHVAILRQERRAFRDRLRNEQVIERIAVIRPALKAG
jgi:hypothetical protein